VRISLIDRSLYYKGLMLLIRKDGKIQDDEISMIKYIGKILGFEAGFCEDTINELMDNKHIIDSPPLFSEPHIALCFIKDGLNLSTCDGQIHKTELAWLESVADSNGLSCLRDGKLEEFSFSSRTESLEDSLELRHFECE
jgi:hypothetical protein